MDNKVISIILAIVLLIVNFANAKPLIRKDSDLESENSLQLEKLIKRIKILEELTSKLSLSRSSQFQKRMERREMAIDTASSSEAKVVSEIPMLQDDVKLLEGLTSKISLPHPSQLHQLIKRGANANPMAVSVESSSKTGFAAVVTTQQEEMLEKTRKCLKWEKQPGTGRMKCISLSHPSKLHTLTKRTAMANPITIGSESSPKTGFSAVVPTSQESMRKKTRECLEWKEEPVTRRMKCIKFKTN